MMLPVVIDLARVPVAVIGRGARAVRRLDLLEGDGSPRVRVFSDAPDADLVRRAGRFLVRTLPTAEDLSGIKLVFITDFPPHDAGEIARQAQAAGVLVSVEDQREWCDVHAPAIVRRGDLAIAVSTNGQSPALAGLIRHRLEALFPPVWADRLAYVADMRRRLRRQGVAPDVVARLTEDLVVRAGWLPTQRGATDDRKISAPAA